MRPHNIIVGQKIDRAKQELARELRRRMTPEERVLWQSLRANRLCGLQFRRQQVIDGFIADFYCHAAAIVVEVDGPVHDQQRDRDVERDRVFEARGIQVVRVTNDEVRRGFPAVTARIAELASERMPAIGRTSPG